MMSSHLFPRDPNFTAKAGPILPSSICTVAFGRVLHWALTNLPSRPTKDEHSSPDGRNNRLCLPARTTPNAILIHTPTHASWLNQVEIYFSIIQRKVLTPNDFASLADLEQRLLAFQFHYERTASPFKWTFTRGVLHALLAKLDRKRLAPASLAKNTPP